MRKFFIIISILFNCLTSLAQTGKLEGRISDSKSGRVLNGVFVLVVESNSGVISDQNGFYTLVLNSKIQNSITVSILGYTTKVIDNVEVIANSITNLDIVLDPQINTEEEVVIRSNATKESAAALKSVL